MVATVHPHSLAARGSTAGAAVLRAACASSSIRINPACVAKPAAAAVAKNPKRPGPLNEGAPPPAKRARGAACGEVQPDAGTKIKRCPAGPPLRKGVEAICVTKNQLASPEVAAAPAKPPACSSMRELLERARLAKARSAAPAPTPEADSEAEAVCHRRRQIEMLRAEARREIELVVRTVEFNDPFIDFQDAFK